MSSILTPAALLILWSLIILTWMVLTRLPALKKAGIDLTTARAGGRGQDLETVLPASVNWKAHNFNHLMEQPTLFYAVVFVLHLSGPVSQLAIYLAWAYFILRVLHSIWQCTVNTIPVRFMLYLLMTLCLLAMSIMGVLSTLN